MLKIIQKRIYGAYFQHQNESIKEEVLLYKQEKRFNGAEQKFAIQFKTLALQFNTWEVLNVSER